MSMEILKTPEGIPMIHLATRGSKTLLLDWNSGKYYVVLGFGRDAQHRCWYRESYVTPEIIDAVRELRIK